MSLITDSANGTLHDSQYSLRICSSLSILLSTLNFSKALSFKLPASYLHRSHSQLHYQPRASSTFHHELLLFVMAIYPFQPLTNFIIIMSLSYRSHLFAWRLSSNAPSSTPDCYDLQQPAQHQERNQDQNQDRRLSLVFLLSSVLGPVALASIWGRLKL